MDNKSIYPIHQLASYLRERSGSSAIVVITDKPESLQGQYSAGTKLYITGASRSKNANHTSVNINEIDEQFLADKILVCIDFLESKWLAPHMVSRLRYLQSQAVFSVIAVRRSAAWNTQTFNKLFKQHIAMRGACDLPGKPANLIAVGGKAANIFSAKFPLLPVMAIVPQFNEGDIIESVLRHLLDQGVDVHVIDNWSTDGSYEKVCRLAKSFPKRIRVERFPVAPTGKYEWEEILKRASTIAADNIGKYHWAMLNDADEIRWSPWEAVTLQKAFSFLDHLGYNSADYTLLNLMPTKEGYDESKDPEKFFKYGEFAKESWAFLQIKAWKNAYPADLASSGSHHVKLPVRQMVYPLKFLLAHYSMRSTEQAKRKIFEERKPRFKQTQEEIRKGWNAQYDHINDETVFIRKKRELIRYNKRFFRDYLIERISGVGLR